MTTKAVVLFLLLTANATALPSIALQIRPKLSTAPQDMQVQLTIPRDPENRYVEVLLEGGGFTRSTGFSIEGDNAAAVFSWWWLRLPCGTYVIRARLTRTDGTRDVRETATYVGADCAGSDMQFVPR